jgi:hypothetical protein
VVRLNYVDSTKSSCFDKDSFSIAMKGVASNSGVGQALKRVEFSLRSRSYSET